MKTGGCSQPEHRSHSSMPVPVSYLYSPAISFCCGNHNSAVNTEKRKYWAGKVCVGCLLYLNTTDHRGFHCLGSFKSHGSQKHTICIIYLFLYTHIETLTICPVHTLHTGYIWFGPRRQIGCQERKVHRMYCHFSSSSHPPSAQAFP